MEDIILFIALSLIGLGSILIIIGTIGLVRLPDVYARIHASGVVDTGGAANDPTRFMSIFWLESGDGQIGGDWGIFIFHQSDFRSCHCTGCP